jgi:hypothetical protein
MHYLSIHFHPISTREFVRSVSRELVLQLPLVPSLGVGSHSHVIFDIPLG